MKIDTEITSQIPINYTFITGKSNINCDYFIDKIEEGIGGKDNKNFQTNVHGYMTSWKYFSRDQEFLNFLYPVMNKIDSLPSKPPSYFLNEAWGIKEMLGHRSSIHDHQPAYLSGVLYLNNHPQLLKFPQIDKTVKPQPGKFVIFSSFLKHGADRNLIWDSKYAVSFNLHYQLPY